jgi:hypothetical protein
MHTAKILDISIAYFEARVAAVLFESTLGVQSQIAQYGSTVPFMVYLWPAAAKHRGTVGIKNMKGNKPSNSTTGILHSVHNLTL